MADATRAHVWGNTEAYEAYMGRWSRPVAEAVLAWLGLPPGLSVAGCRLRHRGADPGHPRRGRPARDPRRRSVRRFHRHRRRADRRSAGPLRDRGCARAAGAKRCLRRGRRRPGPALRARPAAGRPEMARAARPRGHRGRLRLGLCRARCNWCAPSGGRRPRSTRPRPRRTRAGSSRCATRSRSPPSFAGAGLQAVTVHAVVVPIVFRDFDDYWQPHLLGGLVPRPALRGVAGGDAAGGAAGAAAGHAADRRRWLIPLIARAWAVRGAKSPAASMN